MQSCNEMKCRRSARRGRRWACAGRCLAGAWSWSWVGCRAGVSARFARLWRGGLAGLRRPAGVGLPLSYGFCQMRFSLFRETPTIEGRGSGERTSHPTPDRRAGLTCPAWRASGVRGPGGWRVPGFDVDLTSTENGSAGAGRCFVRPWVTAVTPLCVNSLRSSCLLPVRSLTGD
jgi:hypothetical protein